MIELDQLFNLASDMNFCKNSVHHTENKLLKLKGFIDIHV